MTLSPWRKLAYTAATLVAAFVLLELGALAVEIAPYGVLQQDGRPRGLYIERPNPTHTPNEPPPSSAPSAFVTPSKHDYADHRIQLQPGAHLRGLLYEIHINSHSCRGPELLTPKPPTGLRVMAVGGSTTFDIYAPDDASTWPAQVAKRLQEALPKRTVELINAGVPGEIMLGNEIDVERLAHLDPDVLLIYQGPNELQRVTASQGSIGAHHPLTRLALFRAMSRLIEHRLPPPAFPADRTLAQEAMADLQSSLESIIELAQRSDIEVVLSTHAFQASDPPNPDQLRGLWLTSKLTGLTPHQVIRALDDYNDMVRRIGREMGLPVSDIRSAVPSDDRYWGDSTHFTAPGSALAGEAMAKTVLEALEDQP